MRSETWKLTEEFTRKLVSVPSESNTTGEERAASLLRELGTKLGWQNIALPSFSSYNKTKNVFLLLKGSSSDTVILTGHHDTVGFSAYRHLFPSSVEQNATNCDTVSSILNLTNGYLGGRGVFDMKSGLAAALVCSTLLEKGNHPTVLFASFADEEGLSRGARNGVNALCEIEKLFNLRYKFAINTDVCPEREDGRYPFWSGSGGKANLLVSVAVEKHHAGSSRNSVGREALLSSLFSANLPAALLNIWGGTSDGFSAGGSAHILYSIGWEQEGFAGLLKRFMSILTLAIPCKCYGYEEMFGSAPSSIPIADTIPATEYLQAVSAHIDSQLDLLGGTRCVVTPTHPFYPYAPHNELFAGKLHSCISSVIRKEGFEAAYEGAFPLVCDLSFLGAGATTPPDLTYHPELSALPSQYLSLPTANIGPLGRDPHLATEAVNCRFAFDTLPRILAEIINRV